MEIITPSLSRLPTELLLDITSYLDQFTVASVLPNVCQRFYRLFYDRQMHGLTPRIWSKIIIALPHSRIQTIRMASMAFNSLVSAAVDRRLLDHTCLSHHPIPTERLREFVELPGRQVHNLWYCVVLKDNSWARCYDTIPIGLAGPVLFEAATSPPVDELRLECEDVVNWRLWVNRWRYDENGKTIPVEHCSFGKALRYKRRIRGRVVTNLDVLIAFDRMIARKVKSAWVKVADGVVIICGEEDEGYLHGPEPMLDQLQFEGHSAIGNDGLEDVYIDDWVSSNPEIDILDEMKAAQPSGGRGQGFELAKSLRLKEYQFGLRFNLTVSITRFYDL
ncbi:hypothetical protein ABW19_dt0209537 [Dactylella cylindrospora]|nr:hypothetical protein ABW19_dt0209537 [Dactylella cylindrospora]